MAKPKALIYELWVRHDISYDTVTLTHDGAEGGVANKVVDRGIPKHDIVLACYSPFRRQFTEFAVS